MSRITRLINFFVDLTQKLPVLKLLPKSFYRFLVVGGTGFVNDMIFFNIFFFGLGIVATIKIIDITDNVAVIFSVANIMAVGLSAMISYFLNKYWSFEDSSDNVASQFSKYAAVTLFNLFVNNVFFGLLFYEVFLQDGIINIAVTSAACKFISTGFQGIFSYLAYKYVIFRGDTEVISEASVP